MDVLVGTGEIVTCSREENVELFRAFPNSYGSLGYAVRLKIELEEVADFIELAHVRYSDLAVFQDGLAQAAAARTWDGRLIHGPVAVAFRAQLPFLGNAFAALREASPAPVAAAVLCATLSILAMAVVMRILLTSDGVRATIGNCTAITLASNAWSTTIPGGPALSAWLTFRVHRSWGASVGLCGWFFVISGALSTVWMVVIGMAAVLFLGARLSVWALAASLVVAVVAIVGLFWATHHPDVLQRWVRYLPERVRDRVADVVDQLAEISMSASAFCAAALFSLLNQLIDVATLYFAVSAATGTAPGFEAGGNETTIQGVALAYIMTKLAGAAQVTPGGIGTVEPVATASLVASGLTLVDATAATLIYRLISFAFITLIGWGIYLLVYAGKGFMLGRPQANGPD